MNIEKIREFAEDESHPISERELKDATDIFMKDSEEDAEYIKDFINFYYAVSLSHHSLNLDQMHLCNQRYIALLQRHPELRMHLPYLYLKEVEYYNSVNSFAECVRNLNNAIDLEGIPDFCLGACLSKAIDIFMITGLKKDAENYIEKMRIFSTVCDLPPRSLYMVDTNLMQAYATIGKRKEYEYYRNNLRRYPKEELNEEIINITRLCTLASEALIDADFLPPSSFIEEFETLMQELDFSDARLTADYSQSLVPVLKWVKDVVPTEKLVEYTLKLVNYSENYADKLNMYKALIEDLHISKEEYPKVYNEYFHCLIKYYESDCENHKHEVMSEMLSFEMERQYREKAMKDELTGIGNRHAYEEELDKVKAEIVNGKVPSNLTLMAMDVNGLKGVNDNYGHKAGDEYIKGAAECLEKAVGNFGSIFRTGGDEFSAIVRVKNFPVEKVVEILRKNLSEWTDSYGNQLSMAIGTASSDEFPDKALDEIIAKADERMYKDKSRYYQQTGKDRRTR